MTSYKLTKRGIRLLWIIFLTSSIGLLVHIRWHDPLQAAFRSLPLPTSVYTSSLVPPALPPLYETAREQERSLSHYQEYERKDVKYFYSANHGRNSGWGNVMQDFVMMALLAHTTNRSFVFNDYVANDDGSTYSEFNGAKFPSRIPLSALVGGPMVGGPWPAGDRTPLSVCKEFFHKVCPDPTVLQVSDINIDDLRFNDDVPSSHIFDLWVEKLNSIEDPCVMLDPISHPIFEYWLFGIKKRLLSIWPYLGKSPVTTHWGWSPFVHEAYAGNRHLFEPTTTNWRLFDWLFGPRHDTMPTSIPGLLAIHVRRGDFKDHCNHLAEWSSDWNAFNSFPEFPDKLEPPADPEERKRLYRQRCYPTIEEIVEKIRQVRTEAALPLGYLYIMTNGAVPWVEELKAALAQDMRWDHVGSSRDLDLTWEQKFVSQGLDMAIGQRARVFIGNGWSSFTSNVVMLRMAQGFAPATNRFW